MLQIIARLNVGGPALMATVLSDLLDPGRFDHRIVAGSIGEGEGDYVSLRAPHLAVLKVRGLGRAPRPADDLRALIGLIDVIRRFRPHIVHTHTAKAGVLGRLAAWSCGVPATVHSFHGHLLHGYFSPVGRTAVVGVERMLARPTNRLVAVGDRVRSDLLAAGIGRANQFVVVPPGTRLGPLPSRSAARIRLGLRPDSVVVTLVARLTPIKRPERFVQLAGALAGAHPDVQFVVAGGGELLDSLQDLATRLRAPVHFLGWMSDVETVYSASDVVVLTSDNEGMPVSLIEAALAGRPCVTTDVGGASEVVASGTTGIVTATDVGALLAAAVGRLLDDEELRRTMGAAAAERAHRFFGAERLADDIADIYEELAGRARVVAGVMTRAVAMKGPGCWPLIWVGYASGSARRFLFETYLNSARVMSDEPRPLPRDSIGTALETVFGLKTVLAPRVPVMTRVGGARSAVRPWRGPAARTLITVGAAVIVAVIGGKHPSVGHLSSCWRLRSSSSSWCWCAG